MRIGSISIYQTGDHHGSICVKIGKSTAFNVMRSNFTVLPVSGKSSTGWYLIWLGVWIVKGSR